MLVLAATVLGGCAAGPTAYRPYDGGEGYSEQQIDADTWRVRFSGNYETPRETVENYLLFRSAEIMRFGGVDRFIVLERDIERFDTQRSVSYYRPHHRFHHHPFHGRHFGHFDHIGVSEDYYTLSRYTGYATVRRLTGGPVPPGLTVYDARQVIEMLGPTIVLPSNDAG